MSLPLCYIRCGTGRRVAHMDHGHKTDGFWGQVWIDRAHRWSATVHIRYSRVLGPLDRRDPVARRAIRSVTPGRPPCRHTTHQTVSL